jgi:hypothetical protein
LELRQLRYICRKALIYAMELIIFLVLALIVDSSQSNIVIACSDNQVVVLRQSMKLEMSW